MQIRPGHFHDFTAIWPLFLISSHYLIDAVTRTLALRFGATPGPTVAMTAQLLGQRS